MVKGEDKERSGVRRFWKGSCSRASDGRKAVLSSTSKLEDGRCGQEETDKGRNLRGVKEIWGKWGKRDEKG